MKFPAIVAALLLSIATAAAAPASGPFEQIPGGFLHRPSGVVFPSRIAGFERASAHAYDKAGPDVSTRYYLGHLIIADAYVYPVTRATGGLEREFQTQQAAIQQINRNVRLLSTDRAQVPQSGHTVAELHAIYDIVRALQTKRIVPARSQLYVFREGPWFVACRFSYPRAQSATASTQVHAFLTGWTWRPRTTTTI